MRIGAPEDLGLEAAALTALIRQKPERGADALIEFAERHAVDPRLRRTPVVLKASLARVGAAEQKHGVTEEMVELVDAIVRDQEAHGGSDAARAAREAERRVMQHFRQAPLPREVVFEARGLGKAYPKTGFRLRDVSLALWRGKITAVVGENGNGKTTLFRLVAGELKHDSGTLAFPLLDPGGREEVDWVAVKEQLAYVPQELPRWHGSLLDNLAYEAALRGIRGDENRRAVDFMVERLELGEHLGKRWQQLAGGFKLRFALARALVWKPKLLLLDEPLANLDFKAQQVILRDVRDLAASYRYPMGVLISSQHLHEIEAVADDILFLRQGQVVFNGPIEELGEAREHNTFELGCDLDESTLRERLARLGGVRLSHSGLSWVIAAPLAVTAAAVVQALLEQGVEIDYFRDISRSVKQLFE